MFSFWIWQVMLVLSLTQIWSGKLKSWQEVRFSFPIRRLCWACLWHKSYICQVKFFHFQIADCVGFVFDTNRFLGDFLLAIPRYDKNWQIFWWDQNKQACKKLLDLGFHWWTWKNWIRLTSQLELIFEISLFVSHIEISSEKHI